MPPQTGPAHQEAAELMLLYRDDHLVAVHKPAGLLVHRSPIDRHETRFAVQLVRDRIDQRVYPVHRLDRPTSGLLLFALDPVTARHLAEGFAAGRVGKVYLAVARGHTNQEGVIDYPLVEELDPLADARVQGAKPAQPAVTGYTRLAAAELPVPVGRYETARYSLLRLTPRTGRKHQIRRHLKHIFHPIVGDTSHGDGRHNRFFRDHFGCARLLLAAIGLTFEHPRSGVPMTLHCPPSADFQSVIERLGWAATRHDGFSAPLHQG